MERGAPATAPGSVAAPGNGSVSRQLSSTKFSSASRPPQTTRKSPTNAARWDQRLRPGPTEAKVVAGAAGGIGPGSTEHGGRDTAHWARSGGGSRLTRCLPGPWRRLDTVGWLKRLPGEAAPQSHRHVRQHSSLERHRDCADRTGSCIGLLAACHGLRMGRLGCGPRAHLAVSSARTLS